MLNYTIIMGRLTADPELRTTANGLPVTSFTVAVDRPYSKNKEERQTDFIEAVAWRATAEFIAKYFSKGSMIIVEGPIQTRSYTDREGNKRKAWEILASRAHFGESKPTQSATAIGSADEFTALADDDLPF